jgi:hypothetical protein
MKMSVTDIRKMSPRERAETMEALWQVMCDEDGEPDSPDWHEAVLEERRNKIDSGEAQFLSIDEAKKRLSR